MAGLIQTLRRAAAVAFEWQAWASRRCLMSERPRAAEEEFFALVLYQLSSGSAWLMWMNLD